MPGTAGSSLPDTSSSLRVSASSLALGLGSGVHSCHALPHRGKSHDSRADSRRGRDRLHGKGRSLDREPHQLMAGLELVRVGVGWGRVPAMM